KPRLEDLLQLSPKKEKLSATRPWFGITALLRRSCTPNGHSDIGAIRSVPGAQGRQPSGCRVRHGRLYGARPERLTSTTVAMNRLANASVASCALAGRTTIGYVNGSVTEQAILHWIATINKLSFGDFDRQAVINRPLTMMRQCVSGTTDEEGNIRMLTAFVSKRSFAWPTPGEPEEVVDHGRALEVVLELSVVWALPLWFRVHLLPVATSARLQADRAVMLSPSTPSLFWHFTHETISKYQDGYSMYTNFLIDTIFTLRPPSESFAAFLTTRSGVVQEQIFHQLASTIESCLPQPRLVEIGRMPELVRNLSAKDWVRALRSVYGTRALDITERDLILANGRQLDKSRRLHIQLHDLRKTSSSTRSGGLCKLLAPASVANCVPP
ncbi:hypothetical protein MTO96_007533, partial [Rhipicephalus appendiculatus]